MPALHREVELRCLQSREAHVSAESTLVQRAQPLAKAFPGVGEYVHLGRQHRACADGRLFAQLVVQGPALVAQAHHQQHDHAGREGPCHDDGAQVNLDQAEERRLDGEEGEPRVPREVRGDGDQEAAEDRDHLLPARRQLARDADARADQRGVSRVTHEESQHLTRVPLKSGRDAA